jgi:malate synthase
MIWASTLMLTAPMTGCTASAQTIQADGVTVGNMLISMSAVVTDPVKAANLAKIGQGLVAYMGTFQTGSSTAYINDAINAASAILSSLPQTQQIAVLLPIVEAAIDILLANIQSVSTASLHPRTVQLAKIHHRLLRSQAEDMRAAYNDAVKANGISAPLI